MPVDGEGHQQLAKVEGVAGARGQAGGAEVLVGAREGHADEGGHRGRAQGVDGHVRRPRLAAQGVEQLRRCPRLARAERHHERDPQIPEPPREVPERPQRGLVDPLQVVDREQERTGQREVRREPVDAVQRGEPGARARLRDAAVRGHAGRPRGGRGRAGQQLGALVGRGAVQLDLEQLPDRPEGEVALKLAPPRAQHVQARRLGLVDGGSQQRALPVAGRALDHDQPAVARDGVRGCRRELLQLGAALEEPPCAGDGNGQRYRFSPGPSRDAWASAARPRPPPRRRPGRPAGAGSRRRR